MKIELTSGEIETLLTSLDYSKQRVLDAQRHLIRCVKRPLLGSTALRQSCARQRRAQENDNWRI